MSEKTNLTVILAALNAAGADGANAHTPGDLSLLPEAEFPTSYTEVHLSQRLGEGPRRVGAQSQITEWRLLTRAVARRYGDAQEMRRRAADVLEEATLLILGEPVFVERALADDPIGEDDGWWSGISEWSFAV